MKHYSTLFILCLSLALNAQNDTWTYFAPPPDPYCQAARGNNILIGTIGAGIVRFDTLGNRTLLNTDNSTIPSDTVTYLAIDAEENWWMIQANGFSRFDGINTQTWTLAQMGFPVNTFVREMRAAPDSSMYVISDNGVAIFKNDTWSVLNTSNSGLPTNNVWDVAFGPDGKRYFATTGSGIVVQDDTAWTSYTSANTGISLLNNVFSVAVTTEGVLWAIGGTSSAAAIRLAKFEAGIWTGFTAVGIGITPGVPLRKLTAGSAGQLYLTTLSTVSILEQGNWAHYYAQEIGCAPTGTITPVEDGAANIWIFTSCQLARFDGQTWQLFSAGLPGPPSGILYDGIAEGADGSIWIGTYGGAYIARLKNDDTWEQYQALNYGAAQNNVYSIQGTPNGQIWFGLENSEILRYADGNWTLFDTCAVHFPGHFVLTAATAPNGDQWFSLSPYPSSPFAAGLARYTVGGLWEFFSDANAPLALNQYIRKIIFEADGTAWFATTYGGILRYSGGVWETLTMSNSGLPSNRVFYLGLAPDGAIWACTDVGLARFDGQNWTTLNSSNSGLPSDVITRVAFDNAGGMYVGYPSSGMLPTVAVLRGGTWIELMPLMPLAGQNFSYVEPDAFIVDSQNRLWFSEFYHAGVFNYDPMLVSTGEPDTAPTHILSTPNPTAGLTTLQLETPLTSEASLNVLNSLGWRVFTTIVPQTAGTTISVDLGNLPAGVYWLRLLQKGGVAGAARVVKL